MLNKLTLLIISLFYCTAISAQIEFKKLSLDEAKLNASNANKLIFIDFRANWCKPCIEMEKTTFQDAEVGKAINAGYIPVSADVDFFEWMDVQEYYNVGVLPTILILDKNGTVQRRIIGQKTASSLMFELDLPYYGDDTTIDPVVVDVDDKSTEVDPPKKPCFLKRWFKK